MRPHRCSACGNRLQCTCATWDSLHEGRCETRGTMCEDCAEQLQQGVPPWVLEPSDYDEPDPMSDHVKDMTDAELDELAPAIGAYYADAA